MQVAIYIRVSTVDQAQEGYSLAAQERTLRKWCEDRGYTVYGVYADEGISGKDIRHRPAMLAMLTAAQESAFDIILVWALSRLTRSVADLYATWEQATTKGIGLVSYTESFDTSTPTGRAMMGLLGVFAQMEREITAERVLSAMEERARQGLRTCSYVLGYDTVSGGDMTINLLEAKTVKFIYQSYLHHKSITAVVALCRKRNLRGKRGALLDHESIHKILTRFIYCGYYSWHRQPIKGNFKAIIDIDTYNQVQEIICARGERYGRNRKHPLVLLPAKERK